MLHDVVIRKTGKKQTNYWRQNVHCTLCSNPTVLFLFSFCRTKEILLLIKNILQQKIEWCYWITKLFYLSKLNFNKQGYLTMIPKIFLWFSVNFTHFSLIITWSSWWHSCWCSILTLMGWLTRPWWRTSNWNIACCFRDTSGYLNWFSFS